MTASTLTCRCRHCGYTLCYSREDVGHDGRCGGCGQSVRLPGKLAAVAVVERIRRKNPQGLALELAGFALMFFVFPWGLIAGALVVYLGWRKSTALICSNCGRAVEQRSASECPACKSKFGSE